MTKTTNSTHLETGRLAPANGPTDQNRHGLIPGASRRRVSPQEKLAGDQSTRAWYHGNGTIQFIGAHYRRHKTGMVQNIMAGKIAYIG